MSHIKNDTNLRSKLTLCSKFPERTLRTIVHSAILQNSVWRELTDRLNKDIVETRFIAFPIKNVRNRPFWVRKAIMEARRGRPENKERSSIKKSSESSRFTLLFGESYKLFSLRGFLPSAKKSVNRKSVPDISIEERSNIF